jgi:hypothetical protein
MSQLSPSPITGRPSQYHLKPLWLLPQSSPVLGMSVVREGNYLFVWDANQCLQLFNARGALQARAKVPGELAAAAAADSGEGYVAVTRDGRLFSLGPDLGVRRIRQFRRGILALALDPHGNYLLFSDTKSGVGMAGIDGSPCWYEQAPCPCQYVAFMPVLPFMVGCSTMGLSVCYSFAGQNIWQNSLVCHIGALAIRGSDGLCVLSCISEGLQQYSYTGKNLGRRRLREPCRLVSAPFASELFLTAGLSNRIALVNQNCEHLAEMNLDKPAKHIAISAAGDQGFAALQGEGLVSFQIEGPAQPERSRQRRNSSL